VIDVCLKKTIFTSPLKHYKTIKFWEDIYHQLF